MFGERFMGFGDLRAEDHRLFGSDGFLQSHDTNPFLKKNQYYNKSDEALDLCKKLSKMGISCDMSIWTKPEEEPFHGFDPKNLSGGASRIYNDSSVPQAFLQNNTFHGDTTRLLGYHDSFNPNGFEEMMAFRNLNKPIKLSPCLRGNDALMFEGNRVSRAQAAMEVNGKLGAFYPKGSLMIEANRVCQAKAAMEVNGKLGAFYPKIGHEGSLMFEENRVSRTMEGSRALESNGLPPSLVSMVKIYGSVNLMAKDQIGCRVLQKLVDEGTLLDAKIILFEIIDHVVELSMDPFGNYIVQKLLEVRDEEQRTLIVSVITSKPMELIKICLNTYGTRVVQKMIEAVKTKQEIALVKSGLKPGFLALVKDLNGNHVIQSCLESLDPNDNKFVFEAATKYCADIATHRYGCCVLQCCLSNSVGLQRERLVAEISRNSLHLSQDPYGNYVVQYLIEQQVSGEKLLIQFRMHYAELAIQKFSSHVIEKCLRKYPESRAEIVRELLSVPNFENLLQHPYGNYVIKTAISVTKGYVRTRLLEKVNMFGKLKSSPYCKKIFSKTILKK